MAKRHHRNIIVVISSEESDGLGLLRWSVRRTLWRVGASTTALLARGEVEVSIDQGPARNAAEAALSAVLREYQRQLDEVDHYDHP